MQYNWEYAYSMRVLSTWFSDLLTDYDFWILLITSVPKWFYFFSDFSPVFIPNGSVEGIKSVSNHLSTTSLGQTYHSVRSIEETEAAHDLLSLSQSLPPLQAPSAVTIHATLPTEEALSSPRWEMLNFATWVKDHLSK